MRRRQARRSSSHEKPMPQGHGRSSTACRKSAPGPSSSALRQSEPHTALSAVRRPHAIITNASFGLATPGSGSKLRVCEPLAVCRPSCPFKSLSSRKPQLHHCRQWGQCPRPGPDSAVSWIEHRPSELKAEVTVRPGTRKILAQPVRVSRPQPLARCLRQP